MDKVRPADRITGLPSISIWEEMTPLASECKAVNMGQGFPSFAPPQFLLDELHKVLNDSNANPMYNQYSPVRGNAELVGYLRKMYSKLLSRDVGANEVQVTDGVTQALNATFHALVNSGDEIILFEPYFDCYFTDAFITGGKIRYVQLQPSQKSADDWILTEEALHKAVSSKTKIIVVNSPQNVPGKVWSLHELEMIAAAAKKYDIVVISDEVYMHLTYEKPHISIATLPGMWERTLTMCSAGKTFSCTGWKIGWVVGCQKLIASVTQVVSYQTFCCSTPFQIALARAMAVAETNNYYQEFRDAYLQRREILCKMLKDNGLPPVLPSGGFFVMADITKVDPKHYYDPSDKVYAKDWQFCRWITKKIGVSAIPTTAFCCDESKPLYENYARFAFCKPNDDLNEAARRLTNLRQYLA